MQLKILKEIVEQVAGEPAVQIVDILYGHRNVNEFSIAERMKLTINQVRNILYKLLEVGLVSFERKKDKKSGGWYTYYWTLDTKKSLLLSKNYLLGQLEELQKELYRRQNMRFYCSPGIDIEYTEEEALENNFICPESGEVMELKDNKKYIDEIEAKILAKRKYLETVDEEIGHVVKKEEVVYKRKETVKKKKRKAERDLKRKVAKGTAEKTKDKKSTKTQKSSKKVKSSSKKK